jgi:hypothetical protein
MLALSVAWQAFIQHAPGLYFTAAIALLFKAIFIPVALHRIVLRLGIHPAVASPRTAAGSSSHLIPPQRSQVHARGLAGGGSAGS